MAITLFGSASTPADNGTNTTDPTVITPPGSMQTGDLVVMVGIRRASSGTPAISETGGQTWTSLTVVGGNTVRTRIFWCIFNGTWSADPSITMGATLCNSAVMLVFRPDTNYEFSADVSNGGTTFAAPGSPYTVTIPGITIASGAVAIATWHVAAANTFGTLSGAGWSKTSLSAQYRNTSGSDQSASIAYYIGSGATGDVSQNESAGTAGVYNILSFKENPLTLSVNVHDDPGVSDTPTVAKELYIEASDTTGTASDVPAAALPDAEAVNVSDSTETTTEAVTAELAGAAAFEINVSDSLMVIDIPRYYPDEVIVSESIQVAVQEALTDREVNVNDTAGWSDVPTTEVSAPQINVSDTSPNLTDTPTVEAGGLPTWNVNVNDTTGATQDTPAAQVSDPQVSKSESVGWTDTPTLAVGAPQISKSETINWSENIPTPEIITGISKSESIGWTDTPTLSPVSSPQVNVSDTTGATQDTPTVEAGGLSTRNINVSETINWTDTPTSTVSTPQINTSQAVGVSESRTVEMIRLVNTTQAVGVSESITKTIGTPQITISEVVGLTETIGRQVSTSAINVSDSTSVSESRSLSLLIEIAASDNVHLTDTAGLAVGALVISAGENIATSEYIVPYLEGTALAVSTSDSITVTSVNYSFINIGIFDELVFFAGTFASDLEFFNGTFTDDLEFCTAVTGDLEMKI